MNNCFLFVNTAFLAEIKSGDLNNNLKEHFLFAIHNKFKKLARSSNNFNHFLSKIKNKQNNSLFYTGVEQEVRKIYASKIRKIENFFKVLLENGIYEAHLVKTKIGISKRDSLLSILFIVSKEDKVNYADENSSATKRMFFLFPIIFDDLHSN